MNQQSTVEERDLQIHVRMPIVFPQTRTLSATCLPKPLLKKLLSYVTDCSEQFYKQSKGNGIIELKLSLKSMICIAWYFFGKSNTKQERVLKSRSLLVQRTFHKPCKLLFYYCCGARERKVIESSP